MTSQNQFQWQRHPKAEQFLIDQLEICFQANHLIAKLEHDLIHLTSSRLFDWIDHLVLSFSADSERTLNELGFTVEAAGINYRLFFHPEAQLPRVVLMDQPSVRRAVVVKVDCIANFLMVRGLSLPIEGTPYSAYRRCSIHEENQVELVVIERRGTRLIEPVITDDAELALYKRAQESWMCRPRSINDEDEAMEEAILLAEELVQDLGRDLAAWIVMEIERDYWQARNTAGQLQKNRQDRLGMGWANHDHHTFRSSRKRFPQLVRLLEILGFHCRERYWAGREGGWGAQIMENSQCGLVVFLDLDLSPEELEIDFARHPLLELPHHSTVGLWCALHGDSILKAGMHHLEAQFLFEELTQDLSHHGVGMMEPFSSFPYLKQAFTAGEIWHVDPWRLETLLAAEKITFEEAEKFRSYGAVGSHMENLQRREGYKGFNQKNVSFIIKKTDPRSIG